MSALITTIGLEKRRGEEKTVQFPVEGKKIMKGGVCTGGGINSDAKSHNDALELRKEGILIKENGARNTNNLLAGINHGTNFKGT